MKANLAAIVLVVVLAGCTSAPRQTVELADAVNEQIANMQTSHEAFVRHYYRGLRQDVDEFMAQHWTPRFLSNVISGSGSEGKRFREELDRGYALAQLDWQQAVRIQGVDDPKVVQALQAAIDDVAVRSRGELGRVLLDFSNAAQQEIERQRRLLLKPIEDQEAFVLDELRKGYADILAGTSTLKGYVASVYAVTQNQESVARKLGILEKQRDLVQSAVRVNETVFEHLLDGKTNLEEQGRKISDWLESVREKLKK